MSGFLKREDVQGISDNEGQKILLRLIEDHEKVKQIKSKTVEFDKPILSRMDEPLIYGNTINLIVGKTGTHKSRLASQICSELIRPVSFIDSPLGLKKENKVFNLIYLDTERSLNSQLPYAIQKLLEYAGYDKTENPKNLDYLSLLPFNRLDRLNILRKYLSMVKEKFDKHMVIVLDVLSDCISDFNSASESLLLSDLLNYYINSYNVTVIGIIHENPNSDKVRGHLGTELSNKASTVIQIKFDSENKKVLKVSTTKTRSSKPITPFYVQYEESYGGLVEVTDYVPVSGNRVVKASEDEICDYLSIEGILEYTREGIISTLTSVFSCSKRLIIERMDNIVENEKPIVISDKKYRMTKVRDGREVKFLLVHDEDKGAEAIALRQTKLF